jgi:serine/threonine protein kinase
LCDGLRVSKAFFKNEDAVILVFELFKGGELFERVRSKGRYTEDKAKIITRKILEAVAYCHQRNIVHRDIKLENIMLASMDDDTRSVACASQDVVIVRT